MKVALFVTLALLSPAMLSACSGNSITPASGTSGAAVSAADARPESSTVVITARLNKRPISGVQVTLTHNSWPNGKLIAKGKTALHGSVKLTGEWTSQELICAGGKYTGASGTAREASVCEQPLGARVILDFN